MKISPLWEGFICPLEYLVCLPLHSCWIPRTRFPQPWPWTIKNHSHEPIIEWLTIFFSDKKRMPLKEKSTVIKTMQYPVWSGALRFEDMWFDHVPREKWSWRWPRMTVTGRPWRVCPQPTSHLGLLRRRGCRSGLFAQWSSGCSWLSASSRQF